MLYRSLLRIICFIYIIAVKAFSKILPTARKKKDNVLVLATGTFYSDNWLITHLKPLADSERVDSVIMVSTTAVPTMDNVVAAYPPDRLIRTLGKVPARLLYFSWLALKTRPDYLMGFHLLINGMLAILLAKITRARSIYICGGGPREVRGGGVETESRIFNRLGAPDEYIEKKLIEAVSYCDLTITMGQGALEYFRAAGVTKSIEIVAGGFDQEKYRFSGISKEFDLILIGRLSKVKRVDLFLSSIAQAKQAENNISAVIVGDGPDKEQLETQCDELGLKGQVLFAGWQDHVEEWLYKSKVFVLTSESEGLSQAMIQAMMSGLPAVVTNVGDLSDVVQNNRNGYLVDEMSAESFSKIFLDLMHDKDLYVSLSDQAHKDTLKYGYENVALQWSKILGGDS